MSHEDYMRLATDCAKEAEKNGGPAIGAIIVKSGEVVATGQSLVWPQKDPSAHSETNCIREACKKLDTLDLSGCIMYGTLEPCAMCLSCASWANLPNIYFGAYRIDVPENPYEVSNWSAEKASKERILSSGSSIYVEGGVLREECRALLQGYKNWSKV